MTADRYNPRLGRCHSCSSSELEAHSEATYWGEFDLHFVECRRCGLIFADPMPDRDAITEGNRALNILHVSRGTLTQYRGGKAFSLLLRSIRPEGVLLDVGCAEGFFLLGVEENSNWRAEGLEIIESAVEFATSRLGVRVHRGTLEELRDASERYDFIRMNNVIEHVQDPVGFLRAANRLLRPGGRVYCSTPNGVQDGAVLRTANRRGLRLNLLENHFFYYPPGTLAAMFRSCGFEIRGAYCEDVSHTLNDFGLLPGFKYPRGDQDLKLSAFRSRTNQAFQIADREIASLKRDPSVAWWRVRLDRHLKRLRLRLPARLPYGHQQHVFAEKRKGG